MTATELRKKLTLEDYMAFFQNPNLPKLTMDQLNDIVTMHGLIRLRFKKETMEGLKSIKMIDVARSTVGDRASARPRAALELEDLKADIKSLGWEECPIGSIVAVGSAMAAAAAAGAGAGEKRMTKRKKKKRSKIQ